MLHFNIIHNCIKRFIQTKVNFYKSFFHHLYLFIFFLHEILKTINTSGSYFLKFPIFFRSLNSLAFIILLSALSQINTFMQMFFWCRQNNSRIWCFWRVFNNRERRMELRKKMLRVLFFMRRFKG